MPSQRSQGLQLLWSLTTQTSRLPVCQRRSSDALQLYQRDMSPRPSAKQQLGQVTVMTSCFWILCFSSSQALSDATFSSGSHGGPCVVDGKLSSGCCGLWLSHGIFWTGSHMLEIVYAGCAEAGRQAGRCWQSCLPARLSVAARQPKNVSALYFCFGAAHGFSRQQGVH